MALPHLKTRTRLTTSLRTDLADALDTMSESSRISKTKLLDEAVELLMTKYPQWLKKGNKKA